MVVPRAPIRSAARWARYSVRPGKNTIQNVRQRQLWPKRGYANSSQGRGIYVDRSDLPWAIASAVITIPATIYLIQPQLKSGHGDEHAHDEHGAEQREAGEENDNPTEDHEPGDIIPDLRKGEDSEENEKDDGQAEDGGKEQSGEQSEESDNEAGEQEATPEMSEDEDSQNVAHETDSGKDVEGVQFKGATSGGGDTRKHIPDAKGGNKKRIESDYGIRQGVAVEDNVERDESGPTQDKPAAAKTPGSPTTMSGKQEGLSNTDTKHSTDIANNPEKSKKGEGTPETAKSKGTIDPGRPQAENRPGPDETGGNTR